MCEGGVRQIMCGGEESRRHWEEGVRQIGWEGRFQTEETANAKCKSPPRMEMFLTGSRNGEETSTTGAQ
jgi:hypothetical protein